MWVCPLPTLSMPINLPPPLRPAARIYLIYLFHSWRNQKLSSGKLLHNYGKSQFLMGKSTMSMAIFNSKLFVYQRVFGLTSLENTGLGQHLSSRLYSLPRNASPLSPQEDFWSSWHSSLITPKFSSNCI